MITTPSPPSHPPRWRPALRSLTRLAAVAVFGYAGWALWTASVLSTGAPLGWRWQLGLVDAGPPLLLAIGLLLSTARHPTLRRGGWLLIVLPVLGQLLWTWVAVMPHPLAISLVGGALTMAPRLDDPTRRQLTEAAYRQYSDALFCYASRLGERWAVDALLAEDVVQDTFVALLEGENDEALTRDASGLRAHLFSTVKLRLRTRWRSETRRAHHEAAAAAASADPLVLLTSPIEQYSERELADRIQHGLATCPPRVAEAFHLVKECGLSYREAGLVMRVSPKTIGSHLAMAMRRILPSLRDWLPPTEPPATADPTPNPQPDSPSDPELDPQPDPDGAGETPA